MMLAFALVVALHGLIHLLGTAKAFGAAELPQLTEPISPPLGMVWLAAAVLLVSAAALLFFWPRGWWAIGLAGVAMSTIAIVPVWSDAKFGALANGVVLIGILFGFLEQGPFSLRAAYDRDVRGRLAAVSHPDLLSEADLVHLPSPVQKYLRAAGVVGRPRVRSLRARMHGRIRSGRDAPWMSFASEQYNFLDEPARFFYLNASMWRIPVQGYHRFAGTSASMDVKAAALVHVARASGEGMTQSETVTLFNDMCILAPASLVDRTISWETLDARHVKATFTRGAYTIAATLEFDDSGELRDFVTDDRYQLSADGRSMKRVRWSTPLAEHRSLNGVRLAAAGTGRWHEAEGEYDYVQLTIDAVDYNVHDQP